MARRGSLARLAVLCILLWWYRGIAATYGMFDGRLAFGLDVLASVLTAVVGVIVLSETAARVGALVTARPSGFGRVCLYVVAAAAAVGIILEHFGVNVATVLATSALLAAIVGLALQPTLGALIAGLTLHRVALAEIASRLAGHIGPYAKIAVRRAAQGDTELARVREIVAAEIADPAARRAFAATTAGRDLCCGPGLLFDVKRGATGALQPDPALRAITAVAIAAFPRRLFDTTS